MGAKILKQVIALSGLPEDYAQLRLQELLRDGGFDPDQTSLDEIREVLCTLLQDLILATDSECQ